MNNALKTITAFAVALLGVTATAGGWHVHGKTTARVSYEASGEYKARVGETVGVPLSFDVPVDAESVRIELNVGDGLLLNGEPRRASAGPTVGTRVSVAEAPVTVLREGRHYLGITVFVTRAGVERFRSYSVALEAGDGRARKSAPGAHIQTDASGRTVHVLPADETR